jgi:LacI family transcriptional regulator
MTTIRDVAKAAGVAPITVSRVVNRQENVNPETRARVEKAIEELGYVRNLAARSLRSRETYTLALIMPDITNAFWTTVARGVEDAAQGGGYSVLLCNTDENPDKFTKYLDTVLQQRVDGVLVVPVTNDAMHFSQLGDRKVPTVVLDRRVAGWEGDSVYCDSIAAAQGLTQHLLSLGHTSIAIVSGPATTSTAEDRVAGYCLALYKAGLPIDQRLIWRGEFRTSSGRAMTRELLVSGLAPTAIIATNNAIAAGVLEELKNHGKNVPNDMAVVCFDEVPEMERFFPFLTSVTQPAYDMGINATQLLLSRIAASHPLRSRQVVLPTRLILRYSCGRFLKTGKPEAEASFTLLPDLSTNQLVKPLEEADRELLPICVPDYLDVSPPGETDSSSARPDRERLIKALAFEKTDRFPYLDGRGAGKRVVEHVLGRSLRYAPDGLNLLPKDAVEFAQKMGIDALPCEISWRLGPVTANSNEDLLLKTRQAFPPPTLASQLSMLENLLGAAEDSGVGVYVRFSSFFENALAVLQDNRPDSDLQEQARQLEKLMDMLVKHQERAMRAICDRFGRDLCFVSVQDDYLAHPDFVVDTRRFQNLLLPRLKRMLTPAREHGLPVALDTAVLAEEALPGLVEIGVNIVHSLYADVPTLERLAQTWRGQLAFIAGFPQTPAAELDEQVRAACLRFSRQTGLVFSLDARAMGNDNFPPQNFISILRTIQHHRCS